MSRWGRKEAWDYNAALIREQETIDMAAKTWIIMDREEGEVQSFKSLKESEAYVSSILEQTMDSQEETLNMIDIFEITGQCEEIMVKVGCHFVPKLQRK